MQRTVEGPERVYSTARESAAWLGIGYKAFLGEIEARPVLLPWATINGARRWHWLTLVAYAHLRHAAGAEPAAPKK